jgi:predicted permease
MINDLIYRYRALLRRVSAEEELDEELRFHIDNQVDKLVRRGLAPQEAWRQARIEFGGVEQLKEETRSSWGICWVEEAWRDMRFAIRQMGRTPGHTAVAVLSLGLGIGANTAILGMIESTLLQPIAVKDVKQLRLLTWRSEEARGGWVAPSLGYQSPTYGWFYEQRPTPDGALIHAEFAPPFYREALRDNTSFESLFGFKELGRVTAVVNPGSPQASAETVNAFLVSGNFYEGLKVQPIHGRAIGSTDDLSEETSTVAVISYEYWTRRFARDPAVLGTVITLNGVSTTIIGVNPEYFTGIVPGGRYEIWAPLHLSTSMSGRSLLDDSYWRIQMMGRLKPGVSDVQAQGALDFTFQRYLDSAYLTGRFGPLLRDPAKRPRLLLKPGARGVDYVTDRYDRMLAAALALAALVLLIACANVANLLLAQSESRRREISLRLALGAGRGRIVRQLFSEGSPLAGIAGLVGFAIGYFTRNAIPALLATPWRPNPFETAFDTRVLVACLAVTIITGILFSLAPAWWSMRIEINEALKDGSRGTASISRSGAGVVLLGTQVALSFVLLVGAGFCVKTLLNLKAIPLGLHPEGVLLFTLEPPQARYSDDQIGPLLAKIQDALHTIPGVQATSFADNGGYARVVQPENGATVRMVGVGSQFFETMGIPILYGRAIDVRDQRNGPESVVVNKEFGRVFFNRENTVGMTFTASDAGAGSDANPRQGETQYQIVGVCTDWHVDRPRDPVRASFYSAGLQPQRGRRASLKLRISGDEVSVTRRVREMIHSIDPELDVSDVRTQVAEISTSLSQETLMASLASVFAGLALLLALIGIYGVMAHYVARRRNEIGIRMALGARPDGIALMVLRETLLLVGIGVAIGVPTVVALGPIVNHALAPANRESFTYGMRPDDPATIGTVVLVLTIVAFMAGYLPARRAARIDPMVALRHD